MNKVRLGDVCLSITDGEHGSPKNDPQGSYWFLNNNNLTDSGVVIHSSDRRISTETFEQIRKRTHMEQGDVLIATCGTLGKTCIVQEDPTSFEFSRSVGIIKPSRTKLNAKYLHYFFMLQSTQKRIQKIATGGVQKHFYIADMEDFQIYLPDINQQDTVASLLGAIDDKIALNKKLCAELEETAQLIYDYWFTQFDFPDENGNPYRSSGGKMVYNETLKREIPEGWEAVKVLELASIEKGISYKSQDLLGNGIPMLNLASFDVSSTYKASGLKTYSGIPKASKLLAPFDLLMCATQQTPIDPTGKADVVGKAFLVPDIFTDDVTFSTDLAKLSTPDERYRYILAALFKRSEIHRHIAGFASGTKIKHLDIAGALDFHIPLPPQNSLLLTSYSSLAKQISKQTSGLIRQCQDLTALRDWLLPMLMNGQVKVG